MGVMVMLGMRTKGWGFVLYTTIFVSPSKNQKERYTIQNIVGLSHELVVMYLYRLMAR